MGAKGCCWPGRHGSKNQPSGDPHFSDPPMGAGGDERALKKGAFYRNVEGKHVH